MTWRTRKFRLTSSKQQHYSAKVSKSNVFLFRYGDNIRVVNFGSTASQHLFYSSTQANQEKFNSSLQPWNYKFDLNKAQLEENPFDSAHVDNYFKFYLRCFMRRLWPLLSQVGFIINFKNIQLPLTIAFF